GDVSNLSHQTPHRSGITRCRAISRGLGLREPPFQERAFALDAGRRRLCARQCRLATSEETYGCPTARGNLAGLALGGHAPGVGGKCGQAGDAGRKHRRYTQEACAAPPSHPARPRKIIIARLSRSRSSSASFPMRVPTLGFGIVVILSTISRERV